LEIFRILLKHVHLDNSLYNNLINIGSQRGYPDIVSALMEDPRATQFCINESILSNLEHLIINLFKVQKLLSK
jgi:hypothetical protein